MPAEGNLSSSGTINARYESNDFITGVDTYRNVYSETGALINTQQIYDSSDRPFKFIPTNNLFFVLNFAEEIDLNAVKPYLAKGKDRVECKLSYTQDEMRSME